MKINYIITCVLCMKEFIIILSRRQVVQGEKGECKASINIHLGIIHGQVYKFRTTTKSLKYFDVPFISTNFDKNATL